MGLTPDAGRSKIDHLLVSAELAPLTSYCKVLSKEGSRLQLCNRNHPWDHWPLLVILQWPVDMLRPTVQSQVGPAHAE